MSEQDHFKQLLNSLISIGEKEKTISPEQLIAIVTEKMQKSMGIKEVSTL